MCRIFILMLALVGSLPLELSQAANPPSVAPCLEIEVFSRSGCPRCAEANAFLDRLQQRLPGIRITHHDVAADVESRKRLFELSRLHGGKNPAVPSFLMCGRWAVGFDSPQTTGPKLLGLLSLDSATPALDDGVVDTRWFGRMSVDALGLPAFTIMLGLIDGFNPCAMWVLLFLLALLVNLKSRKRMLLIAGTFVFVSGMIYFAFMATWLNVFLLIGLSRALQIVLGGLALLIGAIHMKDFFAFGTGVSLSIPETVKPGIFARLRRVVQAENATGALVGVTIVAVLVNLIELLCTAGLPALYTQILSAREPDTLARYGFLGLYNLAYITDDALMVGLVVYTMTRRKLQETHGRWLKLLSGAVIFGLGTLLLLAPERLL